MLMAKRDLTRVLPTGSCPGRAEPARRAFSPACPWLPRMSAAPPARWRSKNEVKCPSPLPPPHGLRAAPALAPCRRNGDVGPALPSAPPEPRFGPLSTDGGRSLRFSAPTPLGGGKRETSELPLPPHPGRLRGEGPFSDAPDCPGPGLAGGDGGRHCFKRSSAAGASARRSGRRSLPAAPRRRLWRRPQHGRRAPALYL